jgi:small subunit ribosomal protein S21
MVGITVRDGENIDIALRRFKRECERDGILREIKKREFHRPASLIRKEKLAESKRRAKRAMRKSRSWR